jgi:transposase-like protein
MIDTRYRRLRIALEGVRMAETRIAFCSCLHKGQDNMFGKNKRVHNKTEHGWRCTVCGKETKQ